jgi:ATP-dependent DNA ligase
MGKTCGRGPVTFIAPVMPTLVSRSDGWIHEVKFDRYRSQMIIDDGAFAL